MVTCTCHDIPATRSCPVPSIARTCNRKSTAQIINCSIFLLINYITEFPNSNIISIYVNLSDQILYSWSNTEVGWKTFDNYVPKLYIKYAHMRM